MNTIPLELKEMIVCWIKTCKDVANISTINWEFYPFPQAPVSDLLRRYNLIW